MLLPGLRRREGQRDPHWCVGAAEFGFAMSPTAAERNTLRGDEQADRWPAHRRRVRDKQVVCRRRGDPANARRTVHEERHPGFPTGLQCRLHRLDGPHLAVRVLKGGHGGPRSIHGGPPRGQVESPDPINGDGREEGRIAGLGRGIRPGFEDDGVFDRAGDQPRSVPPPGVCEAIEGCGESGRAAAVVEGDLTWAHAEIVGEDGPGLVE